MGVCYGVHGVFWIDVGEKKDSMSSGSLKIAHSRHTRDCWGLQRYRLGKQGIMGEGLAEISGNHVQIICRTQNPKTLNPINPINPTTLKPHRMNLCESFNILTAMKSEAHGPKPCTGRPT